MASKKITTYGRGSVFSLPWVVADEEGYFAELGLEVEFKEGRAPASPQEKPHLAIDPGIVSPLAGHSEFEQGGVDLYRACEWGQVARSHDSARGRIIGKRSAVASQAIIALPESGITHPQDLRNRTVGVNFHHGSHYLAIQTLEGFLEDDEINVVNIVGNRYEALLRGEVDAVAVMEPWITIAEKQGAVVVAEAHYVGSEIAGDNVDPETFDLINQALRKAVKAINADKRKYVHHLIDGLPEEWRNVITPDDFHLPRLRYVDPAPYPLDEFQKTYDWMVRWNLIPNDASFEDLVDNRIAVA